ncbi:uncharacterized protein STEHIDRAFT_141329 [Stereum hirsutum FP-91666 SS1]|uniref:uncharacterized protein n=1 Tax=Stereum hirsutum (strain FP-91666) TaxID=721885 RepID=UPI0004449B2B|nr:uncharacterized protein STEHIDRAFT_141329 [Stereum hirsutum FP-91666 SS1]EIM82632.1 hypothetical protein STEHIDRAFT_141329 [Stereum hirsutum FP-91666 SS1]
MTKSSELSSLRFLDFPLDVRERIYEALLHSTASHPSDHELSSLLASTQTGFFTTLLPPTTTTNLLLANRQLHSELLSTIERHSRARKIVYTLHLFASNGRIYPTWISLPSPPQYISRVHVYFQMDPNGEAWRQSFWADGGPGALTSGLLKILSEFLVYGPALRPYDSSNPKPIHPPIVLDELIVEFVRQDPDSRFPSLELPVMLRQGRKTREEAYVFDLVMILTRSVKSGQLWGRVKEVGLVVENVAKEWDVREESRENILKTARRWAPYGWQSMESVMKGEL